MLPHGLRLSSLALMPGWMKPVATPVTAQESVPHLDRAKQSQVVGLGLIVAHLDCSTITVVCTSSKGTAGNTPDPRIITILWSVDKQELHT